MIRLEAWLSNGVPACWSRRLRKRRASTSSEQIGLKRASASLACRRQIARLVIRSLSTQEPARCSSERSSRPGQTRDSTCRCTTSRRAGWSSRAPTAAPIVGLVDGIAHDVRTALDVARRSDARPLREVTTASLGAYEMYAKAQRARHNNRWSDARSVRGGAAIDPAFTMARAQLVEVLERLGEEAAAEAGRRVVKLNSIDCPSDSGCSSKRSTSTTVDPALAVGLLERLLERYPDEEEAYDLIVHAYTHTRDPAYYKKTLAFMQRWARAVPGPGSGHFHNHYGYAYIEHGFFTEAEREFRPTSA